MTTPSAARSESTVVTMEDTRAQLRSLLLPGERRLGADGRPAFPRSRTVRWIVSQPLGRWVRSALLTEMFSRLTRRR